MTLDTQETEDGAPELSPATEKLFLHILFYLKKRRSFEGKIVSETFSPGLAQCLDITTQFKHAKLN